MLEEWESYHADNECWALCSCLMEQDQQNTASAGVEAAVILYEMSASQATYTVNTTELTCSCYFYVAMRLPCKHMYYMCLGKVDESTLPLKIDGTCTSTLT